MQDLSLLPDVSPNLARRVSVRRRGLSLCLLFALATACVRVAGGAQQAPALAAGASAAGSAITAPSATSAHDAIKTPASAGDDGAFRLPDADRLVAIGDLHGDFPATRKAFRLAGAIDETDKWVGGKLVVVQTGDQLDRGDDEAQIIEFLERLQPEAAAAGGALVVLNGNHETMNVMGDFRYVTAGALHSFDAYRPRSPLAVGVSGDFSSRARAFFPGGGAAKLLAGRRLIVMVGDTVFVHGGLLPEHLDYGIDKLNEQTRQWMAGEGPVPLPVVDPDGPLWTRAYGAAALGPAACAVLDETLQKLGAARMVVGHTVQQHGMSGACNNKVFRIDVGLAAYYGEGPVQVLAINNGVVKIITAPD